MALRMMFLAWPTLIQVFVFPVGDSASHCAAVNPDLTSLLCIFIAY
jgi:hypothetical protein